MLKDMKQDWQACLDNKVGFKVSNRDPGCCGEERSRLRNWTVYLGLAVGC